MNENQMRSGRLEGPLVIVGLGEGQVFLQRKEEAGKANADAMLFDTEEGKLLEEIKPLAIWAKHSYEVDAVDTPIPWDETEQKYQMLRYRLIRGAREIASVYS